MGRKRVLVVDDEPIVHNAIRMILKREVEITDLLSAEAALRDLGEDLAVGRFDAVLVDLEMSGVPDGVDFYRQVVAMKPTRLPWFVFMTGDVEMAEAVQASLGAPCVRKPFAAVDLRRALADVLVMAPPALDIPASLRHDTQQLVSDKAR